jgi:hypothetical protein
VLAVAVEVRQLEYTLPHLYPAHNHTQLAVLLELPRLVLRL